MRVKPDELAPECGAGKPLDLDLAAGGSERLARRGADDLRVVFVGDDLAAAIRGEINAFGKPQ